MKRLVFSIILLVAFSVGAVDLYEPIEVTSSQKIKAVWTQVVWYYYHGNQLPEAWGLDEEAILDLSFTSTAAWPMTNNEATTWFNSKPHQLFDTLKDRYWRMRIRVEKEKKKYEAALDQTTLEAEFES